MTNTKDIIIKLKQVREEKGLSYNDIVALLEKNGFYVSRSTVQRVFAEGSEEVSFKYEETIRPIANALLDIETIEDTDNLDLQAMKSLLKYKIERIEELERQLADTIASRDKDKLEFHEKMEKERERWNRSIEFLKEQISYKDKRMDFLLDAVYQKDKQQKDLMNHILACPYRGKCNEDILKLP